MLGKPILDNYYKEYYKLHNMYARRVFDSSLTTKVSSKQFDSAEFLKEIKDLLISSSLDFTEDDLPLYNKLLSSSSLQSCKNIHEFSDGSYMKSIFISNGIEAIGFGVVYNEDEILDMNHTNVSEIKNREGEYGKFIYLEDSHLLNEDPLVQFIINEFESDF